MIVFVYFVIISTECPRFHVRIYFFIKYCININRVQVVIV